MQAQLFFSSFLVSSKISKPNILLFQDRASQIVSIIQLLTKLVDAQQKMCERNRTAWILSSPSSSNN